MTARSCASSTEKLARPTLGGETLLVGQEFEHDRGRGQRQACAQHDRLRRTVAGERRGAGNKRAGQEHLRAAEAEHQPAHRREPLKRQFQPDEKQEKDDTQFGDAGNVAGVADRDPEQGRHRMTERTQSERAEHGAGAKIAEHRTEAEASHHRHHDARGAEKNQGVAIDGDRTVRDHVALRAPCCGAAMYTYSPPMRQAEGIAVPPSLPYRACRQPFEMPRFW